MSVLPSSVHPGYAQPTPAPPRATHSASTSANARPRARRTPPAAAAPSLADSTPPAAADPSDPAPEPSSESQAPAKRGRWPKAVDPLDALIPTLPAYSYKDYSPAPAPAYTRCAEEADDLVGTLSGPLGFDMEWKVIWGRKGAPPTQRPTALVQVADKRMILLVQVSAMKSFPPKLKELIENPDIVKTGANIRNDGEKLLRDFGIQPRNLVELGGLARAADATNFPYTRNIVSLAKVVALYTGKQLLKDAVRTSDWERNLTKQQIEYAANDAHCAVIVYHRLLELAKTAGVTLKPQTYTTDVRSLSGTSRITTVAPSTSAVPSTSAASADTTPTSVASSATSPTASPTCTTPPTPAHAQPLARTFSAPVATAAAPGAPPRSARASSPLARTSSAPLLSPGKRTTARWVAPAGGPRPRQRQAYELWHVQRLPLADICAHMRPEQPLKENTVISYVVGALRADPALSYERDRLLELMQADEGSWARHKKWVLSLDE